METPPSPVFSPPDTSLTHLCHRLLGHLRPCPEMYLSGNSKYKRVKISGCLNSTCRQNETQCLWHRLPFRKPLLLCLPAPSQRRSSPGGAAAPLSPRGLRRRTWRRARARLGLPHPAGTHVFCLSPSWFAARGSAGAPRGRAAVPRRLYSGFPTCGGTRAGRGSPGKHLSLRGGGRAAAASP